MLLDSNTAYSYDAFNNLTGQTTTYSTGEVRTHSAGYNVAVGGNKYMLSLLQETDDTHTIPNSIGPRPFAITGSSGAGGQTVTRTHLYDSNPLTGFSKDETIHPQGDASEKQVITYDRLPTGQVRHVVASAGPERRHHPLPVRRLRPPALDRDGRFARQPPRELGSTSRPMNSGSSFGVDETRDWVRGRHSIASRMRFGDGVADAQGSQDRVLAGHEAAALIGSRCELLSCVVGEDQKGQGLIVFAHEIDHGAARPRPGHALDVETMRQTRKGCQDALQERAMPAVEALSRIGRVLEVRFKQKQLVPLHWLLRG
jgi:hypothetical protein